MPNHEHDHRMTGTMSIKCFVTRIFTVFEGVLFAVLLAGPAAHAQTAVAANGSTAAAVVAPLNVVYGSLMTDRVEARGAPGQTNAVMVIFKRAGLPVRLLEASSGWQRVEDFDGTHGWVRADMVSRRRTALAIADSGTAAPAQIQVRGAPHGSADVLALLEPGVIVGLTTCNGQVCKVSAAGVHGFINQTQLWGVGANEAF